MDTHIKRGEVYLQNPKHSEKWKRHWLTLYPNSRQGVARLELAEAGSDRSPVLVRRQPERKVVRLSECISVVRLPPHAEAHPVENMAAFCVTTDEKKMVFSVEKEECGEWVDRICEMAFKNGRSNTTQMEENEIYSSTGQEASEFQVLAEPSEVMTRCNLQGAYILQVCGDMLLLKHIESRQKLLVWPFKMLRRYGCDKVSFSFEAGRRCDSGPGMFVFETKQGEEMLHLMELAIQQQKSLAVPGGGSAIISPSSPLPKTPSMCLLDVYSNAEADAGSSDAKKRFSQPAFQEECAYSQPADAVWSQRSLSSSKPGQKKDAEPVYSVPINVINQSRPVPPMPVCGNEPQSARRSHSGGQAEPVYAEVLYFTQKKGRQNQEETVFRLAEGSSAQGSGNAGAPKSKQDSESAEEVIYSQVYKPRQGTKVQE